MKLILPAALLFVLASCDSKEDAEVQELLKKSEGVSHGKQERKIDVIQPVAKESYDFRVAVIEVVSAVHQLHIQESIVAINEKFLSAQTSPGKVELASLDYQDARKQLDKIKNEYDQATSKLEKAAPDQGILIKVRESIHAYKSEYRNAKTFLTTTKLMHDLYPQDVSYNVEAAESAFKEISNKTYADIVPFLETQQ